MIPPLPSDVGARRESIPAFVNARAGSAGEADKALREAAAEGAPFEVHEVEPNALPEALREAVERGTDRLLVAGGDGTVCTAATVVAGTSTALALLPGGTLNHFARDHGIPTEPAEALRVAASGRVVTADVGVVNGRMFLNTSSVGAYVLFVRTRERLERYFGYTIASFVAAIRILASLRTYRVTLDVDGERHVYRTPLVFVGVGERELKVPALGERVAGGRRGLHVMVVRGRSAGRLFAIALAAVARGVAAVSRTPMLDSFVVDAVRVDMPRRRGRVALDGELEVMVAPLEYAVQRDVLRVVTA